MDAGGIEDKEGHRRKQEALQRDKGKGLINLSVVIIGIQKMGKNLILIIRKREGVIDQKNRKGEIITINKLLFY